MRRTLALAVLLSAARALAGPIGAEDPHAASSTGFPGAYLGSFSLSLKADPRYGSRLLDAVEEHLQAVGVMTGEREIADYLEQSAGGSEGVKSLRAALGRAPLDTMKAAALLLADALARPEQFRELLEELETRKHGVGLHAAELLRASRGTGDKKLFAALHEAGAPSRGAKPSPYFAGGRLAAIFDGKSADGREGVVLEAPAAAPPVASTRSRGSERASPSRP